MLVALFPPLDFTLPKADCHRQQFGIIKEDRAMISSIRIGRSISFQLPIKEI
jgi:hypothetical protein